MCRLAPHLPGITGMRTEHITVEVKGLSLTLFAYIILPFGSPAQRNNNNLMLTGPVLPRANCGISGTISKR